MMDVHGHDVERDGHLLQPFGLDMVFDQPAQAGVGYEVGACTEEPEEAGEGIQGEDLATPDLLPDGRERVGRLDGLGAAGDEGAVDDARRGRGR